MNIHTFKKTALLFFPYFKKNPSSKKRLLIVGCLIFLDILAASLVPYFSKNIVDSLSMSLSSGILLLVILLGLFWTIEKISSHIQEIIFFPVINTTIKNLTYDLVKHLHNISFSRYQTLSISEILSCIKRISQSARFFFKVIFLTSIPTFIKLSIAIIVTFKLGAIGAGLLLSLSLCLIILYKSTQLYIQSRANAWETTDIVTLSINDSILNTKKARTLLRFELNRIEKILEQEFSLWQKTNVRLHLIYILIGGIMGASLTVTLYFELLAIQNHTLSIGDFVMVKGQLLAAFLPFKTFAVDFRQLAESMVDIKKIMGLLEIPTLKNQNLSIKTNTSKITSCDIQFENVSFSYPHNLIFQKMSFHISNGQKVAITGNSGSGKSTLVNLLSALYTPDHGIIQIDNRELKSLSKDIFPKIIHVIPQDLRLFNLTLRENLLYGCEETISPNRLEEVLEQVALTELIKTLSKGLETPLGEMGTRLSGGEKQRVAIAHALLLKPKILVLDETTHSLTIESEKIILQEIFRQIPTVILISHRSQVLSLVDKTFVIQNKQLREINNKNSLAPIKNELILEQESY